MWNIARLWVKGSGRLASQTIKTSLTGFSDFTKQAYIFNKIQSLQETKIFFLTFNWEPSHKETKSGPFAKCWKVHSFLSFLEQGILGLKYVWIPLWK